MAAASADQPIQDLQIAAQRLREAVQKMAQAHAGDSRNQAIREGNEALMRVQESIAALPPNLMMADISDSDYRQAMDKLKLASDQLYNAAHALAEQPAGKGRTASLKNINQALLDINQTMLFDMQASYSNKENAGSASGSSGNSATGGAGSSGSGSGMGGSAAVTGRTGGTDIDLSKDNPSGSGTGSSSGSPGK